VLAVSRSFGTTKLNTPYAPLGAVPGSTSMWADAGAAATTTAFLSVDSAR
jgi:hypothetical protein